MKMWMFQHYFWVCTIYRRCGNHIISCNLIRTVCKLFIQPRSRRIFYLNLWLCRRALICCILLKKTISAGRIHASRWNRALLAPFLVDFLCIYSLKWKILNIQEIERFGNGIFFFSKVIRHISCTSSWGSQR